MELKKSLKNSAFFQNKNDADNFFIEKTDFKALCSHPGFNKFSQNFSKGF
jgi:hypothetical protein